MAIILKFIVEPVVRRNPLLDYLTPEVQPFALVTQSVITPFGKYSAGV
jgi:hypothetical protein